MEASIKPGGSYLLEEQKNIKGSKFFLDQVNGGLFGLFVSRTVPQKLNGAFKKKNIQTVWVTDIKTEIEHIKPQHLEQICYTIESFVTKNSKSIVLFTGIEYLISFTSFNQVMHVIQNLRDITSVNNSILIFSVGVGTFSKQEQSLLEQELEVLK